jgi:hypothetical protein
VLVGSDSIVIDVTMRGVESVNNEEKRGRGYQVLRELRAGHASSQLLGGPQWKGSLGRVDVAAGKFLFGVRGPTPLVSDSVDRSTYQRPRRPREQCLESWPLLPCLWAVSPIIDLFGRLLSCGRYRIFLKHRSQLHYSPERS